MIRQTLATLAVASVFTVGGANDGAAVLPTDYTFLAGDSGTKSISSVTLKTAGAGKTVTATDTVTGTITGTQSGLTVNPAAASTLVLSGFANPATANVASVCRIMSSLLEVSVVSRTRRNTRVFHAAKIHTREYEQRLAGYV